MHTWLITVGEPLPYGHSATSRPWRSGILASELVARGHAVTWWTSTVDHFSKKYFVEGSREVKLSSGVVLQFLHGVLYRKNVSLARVRNHQQIAREFARLAPLREPPDLILCSFPTIELSIEAVRFAARRSIPVLIDIRDLWPDEIIARLPGVLKRVGGPLFHRMRCQAASAFSGATGLLAVSEQYLSWGLRHAQRSPNGNDAVFKHGYPTPSRAAPTSNSLWDWLLSQGIDPAKRIFWFVGTFVGSKDVVTVIDAAARLADRTDVQFVLTGSGEEEAELRARAKALSNVVFTGWCDAEQISAIASVAWAGLAAYKRGTLVGLGNKVFEYMAYGLPLLICLPDEARRVVEKLGCGLFFEPESPESLEMAVRRLSDDSDLRNRMADSARRSFDAEFSAAAVYGRMASHLEMCMLRFRGKSGPHRW